MSYTCSLGCLCLPSFWVVWFVTLCSISWHFISLWAYKNKPQAAVVVSFTVFGYSLNLLRWNKRSLRKAQMCAVRHGAHGESGPGKVGWLPVVPCGTSNSLRSSRAAHPQSALLDELILWGTHPTVCAPVFLGKGGLKEQFYENENFLIFSYSFILVGGSFYRSSDGNSYTKLRIIYCHPS